MNLILINGKKRSGKDWFSTALKTELEIQGKTAEIISFAEPMKAIISSTIGISEQQLEYYKNNPSEFSINVNNASNTKLHKTNFRAILQKFGTEAMKPWFGDDVWVQLLKKRAENIDVDYVIVPDFRFLCEDIGGCTVKIRNDSVDLASTDSHASETELANFDFEYIINNSNNPIITPQVKEFIKYLESVRSTQL